MALTLNVVNISQKSCVQEAHVSDKNKENNKTHKIRLNSPKNSVKIVNKSNCFCLLLQIASSIVEIPDNKTNS